MTEGGKDLWPRRQYTRQYISKEPISVRDMARLQEIAEDCRKVRNFVYDRYGGIGGLPKIYPGYTVQNEMTASGYRETLGLPAVYFYLAVFDALADIKSQWTRTKTKLVKLVNKNESFKEEEKHYLRFILKVNNAFEAVLNQKPIELAAKVNRQYCELAGEVDSEKMHRYLCRQVRKYHVKLHTDSCFDKSIAWMHTVEEIEFIPMLHGDELVFNSGLSAASEEWVRSYIEELNKVHAGGMIMSFRGEKTFPQKIIDYCNEIRFPIFSATWTTPYIDIMRLFAEILLKNEQRETNLIAAFKNAIYYPENEGSYLSHFERNGFLRDMEYIVVILSCHTYDEETGNEQLNKIEKSLRFILENVIAYEENRRLIILAAGYSLHKIQEEFQRLCGKDSNVYAGIGTVAGRSRISTDPMRTPTRRTG